MVQRDIFQAIADPTRRQIITMLVYKPLPVNDIAKEFGTTRQAVSLHIQFLNECGLIVIKKQGRERYCEVKLEKLKDVTDWVEESKKIWLQQFQSLEKFLSATHGKKPVKSKQNAKRK